jgi:hypothetical protein
LRTQIFWKEEKGRLGGDIALCAFKPYAENISALQGKREGLYGVMSACRHLGFMF